MNHLEHKVALITGGGRGLGAGISRQLALRGARVAINYVSKKDRAQAHAESLQAIGCDAAIFQADIRNQDEVNRMVGEIASLWGPVEILVNNANGDAGGRGIASNTWENYQSSVDFFLKGSFHTVTAVLDGMKTRGGGRIINIITEAWNAAGANQSVYTSGKGALIGLSSSLAAELGPHGITVNMIAPGWMMDDKHTVEDPSYAAQIPLRRQGNADDIGKAAAFFASEDAAFISGAYLLVSGGHTRQLQ